MPPLPPLRENADMHAPPLFMLHAHAFSVVCAMF
jgi:hypothetical protein